MNKEEPKVLTRMRLSCCWGDNLNEKELNEVVDYINSLQQENKELKERMLWAKNDLEKTMSIISSRTIRIDELLQRLEYTDNILKGDE